MAELRSGGVTLVDELVEGVLPVGPRLTPHDRSSVVLDTDALFGDVLPVRLHVALTTTETAWLLAVGGKAHNWDRPQAPVRWRPSLKAKTVKTSGSDLLEVGGEAVHVLVIGQ